MAKSSRSGGPKTDLGKLASSRNAIKTGSYSKLIILPGESEEDFRLLEEQLFNDFSPQDVAQSAMVRSLAVITWKKLRAEKIEHASLIHELTEPFTILDYHGRNLPFGSHTPEVILGWVNQLENNGIHDWLTAIKLARQFSQKGAEVSELEALEEDSPFVYQFFERQGVRFKVSDNTPAYWASANLKTPDGSQSSFVEFVAKELLKKHEVEAWSIEHIDVLKSAVEQIKEARLLRVIRAGSMQRIHDDLDRAFNRTLNELRAHKKWCRDESAIDVTASED